MAHCDQTFPDETVETIVDCLVTVIFFAATTTTVIVVAYESAGPRVTLALTGKLASTAPVGPCPTDVCVTPVV